MSDPQPPDAPGTELVPAPRPAAGGILPAGPSARRLIDAWLQARSPATRKAYARDLADFAAFTRRATPDAAAAWLLAHGAGSANLLGLDYRAHLIDRKLSPATVNRRLASLRSLVALGKILGVVAWSLEVPGVRSEAYRDTRGPGAEGFRRLLGNIPAGNTVKGTRDRAILRLLYDLGLRRIEVCRLDVGDFCPDGPALQVLGKGKNEKARLTLPRPTAEALQAWLAVRPQPKPGEVYCGAHYKTEGGPEMYCASHYKSPEGAPLFVALDPGHRGHRITGQTVYELVRGLGERAGVRARPHGLRHAAITRALDLSGGNVREVQKFSRHAQVQTLLRYDDARRDAAGDLSRRLAEDAG